MFSETYSDTLSLTTAPQLAASGTTHWTTLAVALNGTWTIVEVNFKWCHDVFNTPGTKTITFDEAGSSALLCGHISRLGSWSFWYAGDDGVGCLINSVVTLWPPLQYGVIICLI